MSSTSHNKEKILEFCSFWVTGSAAGMATQKLLTRHFSRTNARNMQVIYSSDLHTSLDKVAKSLIINYCAMHSPRPLIINFTFRVAKICAHMSGEQPSSVLNDILNHIKPNQPTNPKVTIEAIISLPNTTTFLSIHPSPSIHSASPLTPTQTPSDPTSRFPSSKASTPTPAPPPYYKSSSLVHTHSTRPSSTTATAPENNPADPPIPIRETWRSPI
ncbi:uncharacterized protein EAF01_001699 [Botrytis porri]|uniref:uncharacterized protein n=1 Tax=Botrytis porri TaxID=87229 RepID=UPI0019011564|nr:uncharacterized protein EAF01_001699 [Botrytis porri]KAF7912678.1 hypothetical protein EAF01_001699 [Botrytis porri]